MRRAPGAAFPIHEVGIVALLLLAYAYVFPRWADWNQNSRFDLTVAIVEHGTLSIDCCVDNTGDYAELDGHTFSDKAPGLSLLAVPPHALFYAATRPGTIADRAMQRAADSPAFSDTLKPSGSGLQASKVRFAAGLAWATFWTVMLPSALFGAVFFRFLLARGASVPASLATTLIYGLCTIAAVYSGTLYAHQLAAVLSFTAFALLINGGAAPLAVQRLVAVGLLLGLAVVSEYPAALIAAVVVGVAVVRHGLERRLLWIGAGAVLPLAAMAAYDVAIFGTPLPVGYSHSALWHERHDVGLYSLTLPSPEALWGITASAYRGLFFMSPILLLALAGFADVLRDPAQRTAGIASALIAVLFLVFNASSGMWWGGFTIGPRYLVPMLPFLTWPLGVWLARRHGSAVAAVASVLALASLVSVWGLRLAGQQFPEDHWTWPWVEYAWPRLRDGDLARNAGMLLGLRGWWTMLPLLLASALLIAAWWQAARVLRERHHSIR